LARLIRISLKQTHLPPMFGDTSSFLDYSTELVKSSLLRDG
jgi:hypothetical protein